jgi:PEP-CTERM motif./PA-IL-like protein.
MILTIQKLGSIVLRCKLGTILALLALGCTSASAATVYMLTVPATTAWTDTGIDVVAGDRITISATGTAIFGANAGQSSGPDGGDLFGGNTFDPLSLYPNTVVVSLIGKIGGTTAIGTGTPLTPGVPGNGPGFVGSSYDQIALISGRLFLGFNDHGDAFGDNSGSFSVIVTVPEPSTFALAGFGAFLLLRKRCLRLK